MTKSIFLSIVLLCSVSNAKAIVPGGCLLLPIPTLSTVAKIVAAYQSCREANKAFWYYTMAENKKNNETKGN